MFMWLDRGGTVSVLLPMDGLSNDRLCHFCMLVESMRREKRRERETRDRAAWRWWSTGKAQINSFKAASRQHVICCAIT